MNRSGRNDSNPNQKRHRHGIVALMLIVVLTLLVGTFAISISNGALHEARRERQHAAVRLLESAIFTAEKSGLSSGQSVRLPLDESAKRSVVVEGIEKPNGEVDYLATLLRADQALFSIRRARDKVP